LANEKAKDIGSGKLPRETCKQCLLSRHVLPPACQISRASQCSLVTWRRCAQGRSWQPNLVKRPSNSPSPPLWSLGFAGQPLCAGQLSDVHWPGYACASPTLDTVHWPRSLVCICDLELIFNPRRPNPRSAKKQCSAIMAPGAGLRGHGKRQPTKRPWSACSR
jgi:hypothetical protein